MFIAPHFRFVWLHCQSWPFQTISVLEWSCNNFRWWILQSRKWGGEAPSRHGPGAESGLLHCTGTQPRGPTPEVRTGLWTGIRLILRGQSTLRSLERVEGLLALAVWSVSWGMINNTVLQSLSVNKNLSLSFQDGCYQISLHCIPVLMVSKQLL